MNNHRNHRLWLVAGVFLLLVTLLPVVSACDGGLFVAGTVYEWVDAPPDAKGDAYVDKPAPGDRIIEPVAGASVSVVFISESRSNAIKTDAKGIFKGNWVVAPGRYMVDFLVEKEGYHTVQGKFQHDGAKPSHGLTIFLVRREQ